MQGVARSSGRARSPIMTYCYSAGFLRRGALGCSMRSAPLRGIGPEDSRSSAEESQCGWAAVGSAKNENLRESHSRAAEQHGDRASGKTP
jgi:hypothetical protein